MTVRLRYERRGKTIIPVARTFCCLIGLCTVLACTDDRYDERLRAAGPNPTLPALLRVADAGVGSRIFGQCAACHTIGNGGPDAGGPNLHTIYGKPIGTNSVRFGYTAALMAKRGRWDATSLDAWIAKPSRFIPGISMAFGGVSDPLDRADLIAYIRSQSD